MPLVAIASHPVCMNLLSRTFARAFGLTRGQAITHVRQARRNTHVNAVRNCAFGDDRTGADDAPFLNGDATDDGDIGADPNVPDQVNRGGAPRFDERQVGPSVVVTHGSDDGMRRNAAAGTHPQPAGSVQRAANGKVGVRADLNDTLAATNGKVRVRKELYVMVYQQTAGALHEGIGVNGHIVAQANFCLLADTRKAAHDAHPVPHDK